MSVFFFDFVFVWLSPSIFLSKWLFYLEQCDCFNAAFLASLFHHARSTLCVAVSITLQRQEPAEHAQERATRKR
jgi:hypothetical protein